MSTLLAATSGDVTKAGKAIGLALGVGLGALGAGVGIGNIFGSMIQSVARQPELRGALQGIQWLGFALTEADRQRRLEETKRQIEAETHRALEQIRAEVADLTLIATAKVTGKVLDDSDHRRLIEDAIKDLDFSALEEAPR